MNDREIAENIYEMWKSSLLTDMNSHIDMIHYAIQKGRSLESEKRKRWIKKA